MTYNEKGEYYGIYIYIIKYNNLNTLGYWENGKRHGEGVFTYVNKDIYSGWWKFGKKEGTGTYVFFDTGMKVLHITVLSLAQIYIYIYII